MSGQGETDPARIHTLAIHTADLLDALEARERMDRNVVLRVLPPFAGRMRARLHVVGGSQEDGAIHFHPGVFVTSVPTYPHVDDTADELRAAESYDVATHRATHERAVQQWRETVRARLREKVDLTDQTQEEPSVTLRVGYLG
jgi:hypothetical protein